MNTQDVIDQISVALSTSDVDAAHALLQRLWESTVEFELVTRLLRLLEDSDENHDTMYGIIHVVERASPKDVYRAIAAELHAIMRSAPMWAEFLVARHLSARLSQGKGFDAIEFLATLNSHADSESKSAFKSIVEALHRKSNVDLSDLPKAMIETVCGD